MRCQISAGTSVKINEGDIPMARIKYKSSKFAGLIEVEGEVHVSPLANLLSGGKLEREVVRKLEEAGAKIVKR